MNANARQARAEIRRMSRVTRAVRRAEKAVAGGLASAKEHMVAGGLEFAVADRFAAAFSRGMVAQGTRTMALKLRGRRTKRVDVKLYDAETFAARLAVYRPKDGAAAVLFAQLAA